MVQDTDTEISKSERKRRHKALQDFVSDLTEAPENQLARIGFDEAILEEIRTARKMTKSARNRQIGFISKKMDRELDYITIESARQTFEAFKHPSAAANAHFHQLENWRESLINGDRSLLERLVNEFNADRQQLRRLIREANKQMEFDQTPTASRQLFQYLRKLSEVR
ncbi:MAG: DUF615 domain-containing protein [Acidiferrobacterales bacterium]|nr:DUF615 domain-containing protein [Acidiferrobacterales bacterium]